MVDVSRPPGSKFQHIDFGELRSEHIPELLDLWRDSGLPVKRAGREHPDALRDEMELYPGNFIGARCEGVLVGAVIASWDGRRGWINRLAVHPKWRRQGLAKALVERAEQYLRGRGARIIAALVESDNVASLAFFKDLDYLTTPVTVYLSKRDGPDV